MKFIIKTEIKETTVYLKEVLEDGVPLFTTEKEEALPFKSFLEAMNKAFNINFSNLTVAPL